MDISARIESLFPRAEAIPATVRIETPLEQRRYLVGGRLRDWEGPLQSVLSPVCDGAASAPEPLPLGGYPLLGRAEAMEALGAARAAYDDGHGAWPTMGVAGRIRHVEEFVAKMKEKRDLVVRWLMWEIAKNREAAAKEFDRTVEYVLDTVEALKDLDRTASRFVHEQGIFAQIRRAPLGVVLCMGPYNYPLNETFTTLLPALIMGNTVIFKPAKLGVLLLEPLLEAFRDAFPPGVVNTVYGEGPEVIGPLLESGGIDCLAFIGSSKVADILKHQHPQPHRLRSVLGLGAKNAGILLPDADLDAAVDECVTGTLSYNGQRCTALKILFVHRSRAEAFLARYVAAVEALGYCMTWEDGADITPLPVPGKPEQLAQMVADAVARGASVLNREGGRIHGTYFHPAVVYPTPPGSILRQKEQFGPVVPIAAYDDIAEPIRWVRESHYGQQVALFGRDPGALGALIDPLVNQVCRVNLNSQCQRGPDTFPFTGRKDSAEGTLSVSDALRVFSIRTLVAAKGTPMNREILARITQNRRSTFLTTDFLF